LESNGLPFLHERVTLDRKIYLTFQPVRFTMRLNSRWDRWALTSPFHPYLEQIKTVYFLLHYLL